MLEGYIMEGEIRYNVKVNSGGASIYLGTFEDFSL